MTEKNPENSRELEKKVKQMETRIRHLTNELLLTKEEHNAATRKYFDIFSRLERKIEERTKALKQSREKYRDFATCSSDWIWETDADCKYTYASGKVMRVLGYSPKELLGKAPYDFMPEQEAEKARRQFDRITSEGASIFEFENWNIHRNGTLVCFQTSGVSIWNHKGELTGYRGIDKDITERKLAEEERERIIAELRKALDNIKTLKGLLPICAGCKKIRDDQGYWNQIEKYIEHHSDVSFSHGICPECENRLYGDQEWFKKRRIST